MRSESPSSSPRFGRSSAADVLPRRRERQPGDSVPPPRSPAVKRLLSRLRERLGFVFHFSAAPPGVQLAVRLFSAFALLSAVILGGALVIFVQGRGRWSFGEALYLAVNAASTVGFRELDGMDDVRFSRLTTALIVLAGLGAVAYFQSTLTALLVQGVIGERLGEWRMQKRIESLSNHIVVTGAGSTGMHVIEELHATRESFVVIDRDRALLERLSRDLVEGELLYVVGDATADAVLIAAGINRCRGVVAALTEDKDNLFVTLSARSLNASARIVAKVIAPDSAHKMIRAGANATVSPNMIGGRRLASEIVRPTVVEFIDKMLRARDALRLEEVAIPDGSPLVGKPLWEVQTADAKLLVVALRVDEEFLYNPEPSTEMEVGSVLVVLGTSGDVARLRRLTRGEAPEPGARGSRKAALQKEEPPAAR
jgi:voltage-gated potassium channel